MKLTRALDIIVFWLLPVVVTIGTLMLLSSAVLQDLLTRPSLEEINEQIATLATWERAAGQMDEVRIWTITEGSPSDYFATTAYHYTVDGKEYQGSCISLTGCVYVAKGVFRHHDVLSRVRGYLSDPDAVTEGIAAAPLHGAPPRKYSAHASHQKIDVFYNPRQPESAVLDNLDVERMSYVGRNPQLKTISRASFYGVPLGLFVLNTSLSITILAFVLKRFVFTGRAPIKDPGEPIAYHPESRTYVYRLQNPGQSLLMGLFGICCLSIAYGIWFVNLHTPHVATTGGEFLAWMLVLMFAIPGYLFLAWRTLVYLNLSERKVTREVKLWLILSSWRITRTWPFSDFDHVGVKVVGISTRGSTAYVGMVYLVLRNSNKSLALISTTVHSREIPPGLITQGEELAKRVGLQCAVEN